MLDQSGAGIGPFNSVLVISDATGLNVINPAQEGVDGSGITPPAGAIGIRGWLSGIYQAVSTQGQGNSGTAATGVTPVAGSVGSIGWLSSIYSALAAQVGTAATGITALAGSVGSIGWLSSIYSALTSVLKFTNWNPSTIYSVQQIMTNAAVPMVAQPLVNGIVLTARGSNVGRVFVGPAGVTSATGYGLNPGQSISYAVTDASAIYLLGIDAGDVIEASGN
jgi:hypothetical protein